MAKVRGTELRKMFKKVKLLVLDVDGVLTKGEIIYGSNGEEFKSFNVKDGLGVSLLTKAGIKTVLLTAKDSAMARRRAKDMGADIYAGIMPKESVLKQIRDKYRVNNQEICFVGDDLIDIETMKRIGVPVAVSDASCDVKNVSIYVTKNKGGEGAVREIVERILKSKNIWKKVITFAFMLIFYYNVYPQQKVQDFYLSNYKKTGSKDWEVKGKEAVVKGDYVDIDKMNAKYFQKGDTINIKSNKAKLDKKNMNVHLADNVRVNSKKGISLKADALNWNKSSNKVFTDTNVKVEKKNALDVYAKGMNADTSLNKVKFHRNVKVDFFRKDNVINIKCDGPLEVDYNKGIAVFSNNVIVDNIQGKMFSDKLTVYFNPKGKTISKIVAEGDVKIVRDENVTFAERAIYLEGNKKMILEGKPKLVIFPQKNSKIFKK